MPAASIDIFYNRNIFLLCPLHGQVDFHWKWLQAGSNIYSLMQVRPSAWRLYPVSHTQWKVPRVLIQRCWQPPFTTAHSSMSRGGRQMARITMSFQCQLQSSATNTSLIHSMCYIVQKHHLCYHKSMLVWSILLHTM